MIKLFWNSQNYIKPDPKDEKDYRNYLWGTYHKENSNKWISEVLKKIEFEEISDIKNINKEDTVIIVDSSVEKKREFYIKLKILCKKLFLIHLGDEAGEKNLHLIYEECDFVWRTFCSNRYFQNNKVSCLPIGYKSGTLLKENIGKRKYKWTFIGTPHKSSRHDLLFQLSDIKDSFCHRTEKFNKKIIDVEEMSRVLSLTDFLPCPNGIVHPETYRLYEALECGCIPIVENAYKYYDRLFPGNPFLKIDKWVEAKKIIEDWKDHEVNEKRIECLKWWSEYKNKLQSFLEKKIN